MDAENKIAGTAEPFGPSWYAATMVPAAERSRLTFDLDVDVCVVRRIGGATTARELARRGLVGRAARARRITWNA
jgi:hypothetical protein